MDRPPTFALDAIARSWTEQATPPWQRWTIVAIVSVGLHVGLAGWLRLREPAPRAGASAARTAASVAPSAARSMTVIVVAQPIRAAPPARDDAPSRPRVMTQPRMPMSRPQVSSSAAAPDATTDPSTPAAPQASTASPPAQDASTPPLDLSLTRTPSMQRNPTSASTQPRTPWIDDLRRPATPNGSRALPERRTNDGVQLRRGEDCVELRSSRQAALDPFASAERPAARGLQPCD